MTPRDRLWVFDLLMIAAASVLVGFEYSPTFGVLVFLPLMALLNIWNELRHIRDGQLALMQVKKGELELKMKLEKAMWKGHDND